MNAPFFTVKLFVPLTIIVFNFLVPVKPFLFTLLIVAGITIFLAFLAFLANALALITVTVYVTPLAVTLLGTVAVLFLADTTPTSAVPLAFVSTVFPFDTATFLALTGTNDDVGLLTAALTPVTDHTATAAANAKTATFFINFFIISSSYYVFEF